MKFVKTAIDGLFVIELEPVNDERGMFSRTFCAKEFEQHGLVSKVAQCNVSFNQKAGTLRGLHYQTAPYDEAKLVRCTAGAIFDVAVDLRPDSSTKYQWVGVELTAANRRALFVPNGFAHGFQTLEDDSEVFYQISTFYHTESARGVRWNDPRLGVQWPLRRPILSEKDRELPLLDEVSG